MEGKAVSGMMLALLLISLLTLSFNITLVKTEQNAQLQLETDKHVYLLGEDVKIILLNVGNETVEIGGYPAWLIFTYPREEPVYPSVFAFLAWSLDPGENDTITWNQFNQFDQVFCEPGTYVVRDTQGWGLSAYFKIIAADIIVPDHYQTIQEAINNANEGDTIYVRSETYCENVVVNKTVSLVGEHREDTTIIGDTTVFSITANNVQVSHFNIMGGEAGISICSADNGTISDCIVRSNLAGISIESSCHNLIADNLIDWNYLAGISLRWSRNNTIIQNTISNTRTYKSSIGLGTFESNDSVIYHNNFIDNIWAPNPYKASFNKWDNDYPSGGNYWSFYIGVDADGDGIGDTPHTIDVDNQDRYPLMNPWAPPDIAVVNATPSKTVVGQGFSLRINVTVKNLGNKIEGFDITVYANTTAIQTKSTTVTGGNYATIAFTWSTGGFAKGTYVVSANVVPVPGERDRRDNTLKKDTVVVATPGDVNADGVIDLIDAAELSAHWYLGPPIGPLGYSSNADINNDETVDILDASIVSAYWTGPPKGPLNP